MRKKTVLSWSSGKDSAWALHLLRQQEEIELVGLVTTVNETYDRVTMHAVRRQLLKRQADAVGLPLAILSIPHPCSNEEYGSIMQRYVDHARAEGVACMAFGDLYLEDVRAYREKNLKGTGIEPLFPLWESSTVQLANEMIANGLRAFITCVDSRVLPDRFIGREFDRSFLSDLPEHVDPCGENGEFHSFVVDAPSFHHPLEVEVGETVERDGLVFADILPSEP